MDKLSDEQIIKALECCIGDGRCANIGCPLLEHCKQDMDALQKYALDLINRKDKRIAELQAENERLKEEIRNTDLL